MNQERKYILSISIHHLKEILSDYNLIFSSTTTPKSIVEINMSCPNIEDRIPGYHCKDILDVIQKLKELQLTNLVCGLKLPPFFEIEKIKKVANILQQHKDIIRFIVCSNTIPNGLCLSSDVSFTGGISSKVNKYISLSNIKIFRKYLSDIYFIGCGGIDNEIDIIDYLNEGATLIQVGSCFYDEGRDGDFGTRIVGTFGIWR
jgi:dihydroorotate dehydrogenase (fumarate)